jgi:hypothetical protein
MSLIVLETMLPKDNITTKQKYYITKYKSVDQEMWVSRDRIFFLPHMDYAKKC